MRLIALGACITAAMWFAWYQRGRRDAGELDVLHDLLTEITTDRNTVSAMLDQAVAENTDLRREAARWQALAVRHPATRIVPLRTLPYDQDGVS